MPLVLHVNNLSELAWKQCCRVLPAAVLTEASQLVQTVGALI